MRTPPIRRDDSIAQLIADRRAAWEAFLERDEAVLLALVERTREQKAESRSLVGLDPWLSVAQAAEITGLNRQSIYRAIKDGRLPCRRDGTAIRILQSVLMEWGSTS